MAYNTIVGGKRARTTKRVENLTFYCEMKIMSRRDDCSLHELLVFPTVIEIHDPLKYERRGA